MPTPLASAVESERASGEACVAVRRRGHLAAHVNAATFISGAGGSLSRSQF